MLVVSNLINLLFGFEINNIWSISTDVRNTNTSTNLLILNISYATLDIVKSFSVSELQLPVFGRL